MKKDRSFVYIGIIPAPSGNFYVKVGKTNHPERRLRAYKTHLPTGLDAMYGAECPSDRLALAKEKRIIRLLSALEGVQKVSEEWFLVKFMALDEVFVAFSRAAGEPVKYSLPEHYRAGAWRIH